MVTLVGGTFSHMHKGHKLLLRTAIETGERVIVGLTTDTYTKANKDYKTKPFSVRKNAVERFMNRYSGNYEILPLESRKGNSDTTEEYNCIVVSKETERSAIDINARRKRNGLSPLKVITVPYVLAEDLFPISSSRIHSGEIDTNGHRKKPIRISISTRNDLKVNATRKYLSTIMKNTSFRKFSQYNLSTQQPLGEDTPKLATQRAINGLEDFDYSIGIESGLIFNRINATYLDVHFCCVIDRLGRITVGTSSGFQIPDNILDLVKRGATESQAFGSLYGDHNIGNAGGIVGEISAEGVKRQGLIEESVRNAFIPRFSPDYFPELFSPL